MERKKKEAVRGKHIKEKPDSKLTPKAAMRRAGRYKAIETARKQVQEAQQQEQEPYSATDKLESYTAGAVHEIIRYPRHENNPFHRETDCTEAPAPKAPTPQERMRWEAVREYRQAKVDQVKDVSVSAMRNADTPRAEAPTPQRHTYNEARALKQPTPQECMRREAVKEYQQVRAEQGKNAFHHETDYTTAPSPKAPTPQERMRWEAVKEYRQTKAEQSKNAFHRETDYTEVPAPKAPTPQERMRREAVKEYRQTKAEQSKNAFHRETDYIEAPAPRTPTSQERMRREAVREYKQAKAEQSINAFHRETNYIEAPPPKQPTLQERMRREAVKEYQQARTDQSKNAFHREMDYLEALTPRAEKPQKQMLQTFLDGEKETAPLLQASEVPAVNTVKNEVESAKPHIRPKKREVRESVKSPITVTGQRQTALPRNTSSIKTAKKQLIKEQGRKAAREKAVKELTTGTVSTSSNVIKALSVAVSRALTPSRETLIYAAGILILILIPFVVIMGVASMLTSTGKGRDNFVPVSEDVEGYRPLIRQYAAEFGIPEFEDLIAAVMMQESGGQTSDPMQCSESGYNTEYPREPGGITDPEYSIKVGVQTLAEVLDMAGVDSPVDLDRISLALQGYNYGSGYIYWALSNYGGYSELNAIEYSDMMAEQYGWSGYGDKSYVSHVLRYYPIGRSFMSEGDAAIVAVAQTQIGNEGGLKYCEWYGYSYRVEWCAIFVSWCADQCGYLDAGILPKELNVIPYVEWFRERDQWQYIDDEPSPSDLIFYDWESDGLADHVGIVERVEDGIVYSIEGNAGDACIENSHYLATAPIYGYGTPAY